MTINSQAKGKRAERFIANALNPILANICIRTDTPLVKLNRNLVQSRAGGCDLDGLDWIAIEIKHHQTYTGKVAGWWAQTLRQAGPRQDERGVVTYDREPVLIYKGNGTKWRVRMFGRFEIAPGRRLRIAADVTWEDFLIWFERRATVEVEKTKAAQIPVDEPGLFG